MEQEAQDLADTLAGSDMTILHGEDASPSCGDHTLRRVTSTSVLWLICEVFPLKYPARQLKMSDTICRKSPAKMKIVESHQLSLIYTLEGVDSGELTARVVKHSPLIDILPVDLTDAVVRELEDATTWVADPASGANGNVDRFSSDLAAPVRNLLSGASIGQLQRLVLSPECAQILQFGDLPSKYDLSLSKKMICLELGKRATERLAEQGITARPLWINPTQTELLQFGTGASIVVVQVEIMRLKNPELSAQDDQRDLSFVELQEAVHALSRFNTCRWYDRSTSNPIAGKEFSFGLMVQGLVRDKAPTATHFTRVHTHTFARFAQTVIPEILEQHAASLARRYTSDYQFSKEEASVRYIRDFIDLRHAVTAEGFASVQCKRADHPETEFSKNWKAGPLAAVYLPIYILLLHENWFLSERQKGAAAAEKEDELLEALEQVIDDAVLFQLYYRFPSFSQISMHQQAAEAMRKELRLDAKFAMLTSAVSQVSERLRAAQTEKEAEERRERNKLFNLIATFGTAGLVGVTAYTVFKDFLLLLALTFDFSSIYPAATADTKDVVAGWGAFGLSAVMAAITFFIVRHFAPEQKDRGKSARIVLLNRLAAHLRRGGS
ncbi:MAG: hypothetical protein ABJH45_16425 [Paracoccaceae bacterium]